MTRQIKFRAWDNDAKEFWALPFFVNNGKFIAETPVDGLVYADIPERFEVMQFTGIRDRNGNEIYESDIVHYLCTSGELHWDMKEEIKWAHGAYRFGNFIPGANMPGCLRDYENQPWLEVIGNIYENPDLINPIA